MRGDGGTYATCHHAVVPAVFGTEDLDRARTSLVAVEIGEAGALIRRGLVRLPAFTNCTDVRTPMRNSSRIHVLPGVFIDYRFCDLSVDERTGLVLVGSS